MSALLPPRGMLGIASVGIGAKSILEQMKLNVTAVPPKALAVHRFIQDCADCGATQHPAAPSSPHGHGEAAL